MRFSAPPPQNFLFPIHSYSWKYQYFSISSNCNFYENDSPNLLAKPDFPPKLTSTCLDSSDSQLWFLPISLAIVLVPTCMPHLQHHRSCNIQIILQLFIPSSITLVQALFSSHTSHNCGKIHLPNRLFLNHRLKHFPLTT